MKTALVVDSSASINDELRENPDVYVVNLSVNFPNGKTYIDTTDEEKNVEFYELLESSEDIPTTSQPTGAEYIKILDEIVDKEYDQVIMILLSSAISGTYATGVSIAKAYEDKLDIRVVDSKGTSFLIENMLQQALEMLDRDYNLDKIEEKLNWVADNSIIYASIENLTHIVKGGRISGITGSLGNMLSVKPILYFNDGKVEIYKAVRTNKRVYKTFANLVDEAIEAADYDIDIAFAHGNCEEDILEIKQMVEEKHTHLDYRIGFLTIMLATHGGPGTKGMGIIARAPLD